jgi:carboxyl-terminal processing protease
VQPDVVLPDPTAHVESGERFLDNAIPWSSINPLPATPWPQHDWSVSALNEKSHARQLVQPIFGKVTARSEYVLTRRKDTLVPLKRDAWLAQREKDREALESLDAKLAQGPERFSVKLVDYRPVAPSLAAPAREPSRPRVDKWKETLAHDPWVEESLYLLLDMAEKKPAK